jgi:hypothetical protein
MFDEYDDNDGPDVGVSRCASASTPPRPAHSRPSLPPLGPRSCGAAGASAHYAVGLSSPWRWAASSRRSSRSSLPSSLLLLRLLATGHILILEPLRCPFRCCTRGVAACHAVEEDGARAGEKLGSCARRKRWRGCALAVASAVQPLRNVGLTRTWAGISAVAPGGARCLGCHETRMPSPPLSAPPFRACLVTWAAH